MLLKIKEFIKKGQEPMFYLALLAVAIGTSYYFRLVNPEYIVYKDINNKIENNKVTEVTAQTDRLVWEFRNTPELACKIAIKLQKAKQTPSAIALIHGTISRNSKNLLVVKTYVGILWEDNNPETALSVISLYTQGNRERSFELEVIKCSLLVYTGKYQEAFIALNSLPKIDEDGTIHSLRTDKTTGPLLAETLMRTGSVNEGIAIYAELLKEAPKDKMLRINYARTLISSAKEDIGKIINKTKLSNL